MTIEAGQLIAGHYRLVEHIGTGAMGVVWRAVDERLGRSVAVKKIVGMPGLSEADRAERDMRATREARNAARLQHANAIVVFDITEDAGDPCLVMEYVPSRSLSELLAERGGTLDVGEAMRIGEQVAGALVAAHHVGLVHRDVKPGNILIADNGVAKLTDFGISRAQGDATLTQTGLVGGTPAYIAPELARGGDPTPASDVFALGATLYHAIEGQSPYGSNPNQLALLHAAASGRINPPQAAGPATALLMSMLRVDAEERIAMRQAAQRLTAVATGGGFPEPPAAQMPAPPPPDPGAPPWRRTSGDTAAAGTAIAPAGDGAGGHGTAAMAVVGPNDDQPEHQPTAAGAGTQQDSARRKRTAAIVAGVVAVLLVLGIGAMWLFNDSSDPNEAAPPPETTRQQPTSEQAPTTTTTTQTGADDPIEWGPAGQLVIDFYTFPDGADAAWEMLTPEAREDYGDRSDFDEHWNEQGQTYAQDASASANDDGSVTISVTVVTEEDGSDDKEVRVVRGDNGDLMIDSDTS